MVDELINIRIATDKLKQDMQAHSGDFREVGEAMLDGIGEGMAAGEQAGGGGMQGGGGGGGGGMFSGMGQAAGWMGGGMQGMEQMMMMSVPGLGMGMGVASLMGVGSEALNLLKGISEGIRETLGLESARSKQVDALAFQEDMMGVSQLGQLMAQRERIEGDVGKGDERYSLDQRIKAITSGIERAVAKKKMYTTDELLSDPTKRGEVVSAAEKEIELQQDADEAYKLLLKLMQRATNGNNQNGRGRGGR